MANRTLQGIGQAVSGVGQIVSAREQAKQKQQDIELKKREKLEADQQKRLGARAKIEAANFAILSSEGNEQVVELAMKMISEGEQITGEITPLTTAVMKSLREQIQTQAQSPISFLGVPAQHGSIGRETGDGFQPLANIRGLEGVARERGIPSLELDPLFSQTDQSGLGTAGGARDLAPLLQEIFKQAEGSLDVAARVGLTQEALNDPRLAATSTRAARKTIAEREREEKVKTEEELGFLQAKKIAAKKKELAKMGYGEKTKDESKPQAIARIKNDLLAEADKDWRELVDADDDARALVPSINSIKDLEEAIILIRDGGPIDKKGDPVEGGVKLVSSGKTKKSKKWGFLWETEEDIPIENPFPAYLSEFNRIGTTEWHNEMFGPKVSDEEFDRLTAKGFDDMTEDELDRYIAAGKERR